MKARVKWVEGACFLGESTSGHAVVMDGPPEGGGRNLGLRPMEMLLLGLGGCSAYDVVSILRKARQDVDDCYVEIEAERADHVPRVFTRIHMHFVVSGRWRILPKSRLLPPISPSLSHRPFRKQLS